MQVPTEARRGFEEGAESIGARVIGEPLCLGAGDWTGLHLKSSTPSYCLVTSLAFWPHDFYCFLTYLPEISLPVVFIFQIETNWVLRRQHNSFHVKELPLPGHPETRLLRPVLFPLVFPAGLLFFYFNPWWSRFHFGGTFQMTASRIATCCAFTYLKPEAVSLCSSPLSTPNHLHCHPDPVVLPCTFVVVFDSTTVWVVHRFLHKNGEPNQESGLTQGTASMFKGACSHWKWTDSHKEHSGFSPPDVSALGGPPVWYSLFLAGAL